MKFEVTEKGVRGADVGTVLEILGNTIPAHLVNKGHPVGGSSVKTAVTNPASGAKPEYEAVHRGGGHYSVMKGEAEVMSGLSKDDATAFNDLSDADKAEYLATEAE